MILVDSSVWIEHFRAGNDRLKDLLLDEQVLCHRFVVGELTCGMLQKRREILSMLKALPEAHLLEHEGSDELYTGAAFIRPWHWLGRRSSSRFDAAHKVRNLDIRQTAPERSGCFEHSGVNVSDRDNPPLERISEDRLAT